MIFNKKILLGLTLILSLLGISTITDDDHAALVLFSGGFVYSAVLYISLLKKPSASKVIAVSITLGVANFFVFYALALLIFIPEYLHEHLAFLFPSILGAGLTLLCLVKVWDVPIQSNAIFGVLALVSFSSILTPIVLEALKPEYEFKGAFISLNSVFWWIAFTLGLLLPEKKANKAMQPDV